MNKYERCLWEVGTFIDYGDMSLKELNERFRDYSLNYDGEEIPARTFDRMRGLSIGEKSCQPSPDITPRLFYRDCFGIIRDDKQPEEIVLKVYGHQVDYVRSTPIHASQKEIETTREYALFQYYLRPSFDFVQHLLWHRENLEVVRPTSLRDETRELLRQMLARYEKAPDR